jgi:hypothetical protein
MNQSGSARSGYDRMWKFLTVGSADTINTI